jgi:hypothetical protein
LKKNEELQDLNRDGYGINLDIILVEERNLEHLALNMEWWKKLVKKEGTTKGCRANDDEDRRVYHNYDF